MLKIADSAGNVFTIPQRHAVSLVAPFARADRFSVTGWFRTGRDPKGAVSTA
jgi:SM-20-related protein